MIHIFTALYPEAKPLIQALGLKKRAAQTHYQQFLSEAQDLTLTITGVGPMQAAAVTASVLTDFDAGASDQLLSLGTAARLTQHEYSERNEAPRAQATGSGTAEAARKNMSDERAEENAWMYHIHRITDAATKRDFYPDMLLNTGLPEASLITGASLLSEAKRASSANGTERERTGAEVPDSVDLTEWMGDRQNPVRGILENRITTSILYDMEAAAVYQAASMFLGPHQMNFLRIVTDQGISETEAAAPQVLATHVTDCVTRQVDTIVAVVDKLRALTAAEAAGHHVLTENEQQLVDKLISDAHFSKVMADECVQLIRYAALSHLDWQCVVKQLYDEGLVPTRDKRAGKIILERYLKSGILTGSREIC